MVVHADRPLCMSRSRRTMTLSGSFRPRGGGMITSHLFQTDRYPAHCSRHLSADLWAAELQDHAIGILQLNAGSPSNNCTTSSDRAVRAFKRSRAIQVEGLSDQLGCRGSDREADVHARYGERVALASEGQHALAAADPDDEPPLVNTTAT